MVSLFHGMFQEQYNLTGECSVKCCLYSPGAPTEHNAVLFASLTGLELVPPQS